MRRCTLVRVEQGDAVWVSQCCLVWDMQEQTDEKGTLVDVVQRFCPHCGSNHGEFWATDDSSRMQIARSEKIHQLLCVRGSATRRSGGSSRRLAVFKGWCVSCEKTISVGVPITSSSGAWVHEGCS